MENFPFVGARARLSADAAAATAAPVNWFQGCSSGGLSVSNYYTAVTPRESETRNKKCLAVGTTYNPLIP